MRWVRRGRRRGLYFRDDAVRAFGVAGRRCVALGVWALGFAGWSVAAQDAPTLHVYTNLVQIPTLVIDSGAQPVTEIEEKRLLCERGWRAEVPGDACEAGGDDPISLAIVLDVSQPFPVLMTRMDDAVAGLAPLSLHAKDRVSVYSMDCNLGRSGENVRAAAATLHRDVDAALEQWRAHGRDRWKSECKTPANLWDSLTVVTQALANSRGGA